MSDHPADATGKPTTEDQVEGTTPPSAQLAKQESIETVPAVPSGDAAVIVPPAAKTDDVAADVRFGWPGAGLGLLVGITMGLARTPVVREFLVAVVAATFGYLGLSKDIVTASGKGRAAARGIVAFSFVCVIGILGGIALRVVDPIGNLAIRWRHATWVAVGADRHGARTLVIDEFGRGAQEGVRASDAGASAVAANRNGADLVSRPGASDETVCSWWQTRPRDQSLTWLDVTTEMARRPRLGIVANAIAQGPHSDLRKVEILTTLLNGLCPLVSNL